MFMPEVTELDQRVAHLAPIMQLAFNSARLAAARLPNMTFGDHFETLLTTLESFPRDDRVTSDALEALRVFWSSVG